MSTPPFNSIGTITGAQIVSSIMTNVSADPFRPFGASSSAEMLITPARSFSGHGRFADVIQVFAWVAENTSDYAITQRDRKDGAGLRADDLIEFQIILSGDESEAVAFQLRWLGGAE